VCNKAQGGTRPSVATKSVRPTANCRVLRAQPHLPSRFPVLSVSLSPPACLPPPSQGLLDLHAHLHNPFGTRPGDIPHELYLAGLRSLCDGLADGADAEAGETGAPLAPTGHAGTGHGQGLGQGSDFGGFRGNGGNNLAARMARMCHGAPAKDAAEGSRVDEEGCCGRSASGGSGGSVGGPAHASAAAEGAVRSVVVSPFAAHNDI